MRAHSVKHSQSREIAKYLVSAVVVAIGIAAFFFLKALAEPPETQKSTALVQQVATYEIQPYAGLLDMMVSGVVVPHREIKIAAEVAGRIDQRFPACEAGNFVSKGETLLQIDQEEYELEIKTLEADVSQSEKRIEENLQQIIGEERNIELAKKDFELQKKESVRNARLTNVLSQTELDQSQRALNSTETQLTTRQNNLATLKAGTTRLQAALEFSERQLEKATLNLRRTTVSAPDDGVIVRTIVHEGDYVTKGMQIITFEDTKQAEVLCNLTPSDLKWIRDNSPADAELVDNNARSVYRIPKTLVTMFDPSDPSVTWSGVLERFDGIGRDDVTKTIPCRISIRQPIAQTPNGPQALVRGMYVKCRMEVQTSSSDANQRLFSFPAVALHPSNHVWTVKDKKLKRIDVSVVDRTETIVDGKTEKFVIVTAAPDLLQPGDAVVVSPLSQPSPGATVILESETKSTSPADPVKPE